MADTQINFVTQETILNFQEGDTQINFVQPVTVLEMQTVETTLNFVTPAVTLNFPQALPGPPGPPGAGSAITIEAGEDLAAGDMVYIAPDGLAYKADASDPEKACIAVAATAITTGNTGDANTAGSQVGGYTGLTPNARLFLSSTPGTFFDTMPGTDGHIVQQIGTAISSTDILFNPSFSILL